MLKKINKRKFMDPKRISNYNKFLTTLDQNSELNPSLNPVLSEKYKNLKTENDIKNEIDKIIETINNNFKINNYSSNFTGQMSTDINIINNDDPNYYREIMNINHKYYKVQLIIKINLLHYIRINYKYYKHLFV
jgi:hypothetical protein